MIFEVNRFHLTAFITWQLANFTVGQYLLGIFSNDVPQWRCGNSTFSSNCTIYETCPKEDLVFVNPVFNSIAMEFDWVCGFSVYYKEFFSLIQYMGVLVGTLLFGTLSDKYGRKPIGITVIALAICALFVTGMAPNRHVLFLARFCVGLSIAGVLVVICAWIMEVILPDQRMVLRGFFNWGWTRIFLTSVCFITKEWRTASYISALCLFPALFMVIFFIPESPTWLHNKGMMGRMIQSEMFMARIAGKPYKYVEHKFVFNKTLMETLKTKGLFKKLFVLWTMWFLVAVCGFANDLNSNTLAGNLYLNQLLIGILVVASKWLLLFADKTFEGFTRRTLHLGSQFGTIVCFSFLTVFLLQDYQGYGFLIVYLIGTVCIEYTWDACYLCAIESMETSSRTSATGSCSFMARIGSLLAPFLKLSNNYWPPAVYVTVIVLCSVNFLISYFFLKETKDVDLDKVHIDEDETPEQVEMIQKGL